MQGIDESGKARQSWRSTDLPGQRHLELPVIGSDGTNRWLYASGLPDGPLRFGADARREVRAVKLRCPLPS
jgi:hypothetical protein